MSTFKKELSLLLNKHSKENASATPDFILAEFLRNALIIFDSAVQQREKFYGRDSKPPDFTSCVARKGDYL